MDADTRRLFNRSQRHLSAQAGDLTASILASGLAIKTHTQADYTKLHEQTVNPGCHRLLAEAGYTHMLIDGVVHVIGRQGANTIEHH